MNKQELIGFYSGSAAFHGRIQTREERFLIVLSLLRLVCFAGGLIGVVFIFIKGHQGIALGLGFIFLLVFLYLLRSYSEHSILRDLAANRVRVNKNEIQALEGDFSAFNCGDKYIDHQHDYSYDIDIFGEGSLFGYLNRCVTSYGSDILACWLSNPYDLVNDLKNRQEIIKELAEKVEWRHEFMAEGMRTSLEKNGITRLFEWMRNPIYTKRSQIKVFLIYTMPVVAVTILALVLAGYMHHIYLVLVLLFNLGFVAAGMRRNNKVHQAVSGHYTYLSSMNRLLEVVDKGDFRSGGLIDIKNDITGSSGSASRAIKKLGKLIQAFDSRLNIFAGFILNGFLLWDYHCIVRIDRWRNTYKDLFPSWLDVIGSLDAFSALANNTFNNPGFVFPQTSPGLTVFKATAMGHPLIDERKRVCNDFEIEKNGRICIITGANMAGKSTFLRTVAINYILAMTGSPVCASQMNFIPLKLFTSMRTTDSLSDNESYFYAELKRLSLLKDRTETNDPVFFILDEILKGTNSADKTYGSRLFIIKLISNKGTGMIATHDISLGDLEKEFPENIFNKCFEIDISGDSINFDYKLQDGITRKMNAVLLMRKMGILE